MSARTCSSLRAEASVLAALLSPFVDQAPRRSYESGRKISRGGTVKADDLPARFSGALWVVSRRRAGGCRGASKLREVARHGHGHAQSGDACLLRRGALLEACSRLHARVFAASSRGPGEDE